MKCQVCGKKNDDRITIVVSLPEGRMDLKVCGDCMNLYGAEEFDELTERLEMNYAN